MTSSEHRTEDGGEKNKKESDSTIENEPKYEISMETVSFLQYEVNTIHNF